MLVVLHTGIGWENQPQNWRRLKRWTDAGVRPASSTVQPSSFALGDHPGFPSRQFLTIGLLRRLSGAYLHGMSRIGIDLATYKDRFRQVASERQASEAEVEGFLAVLRPRVALHEQANDGGVVFRYGGLPRLPEDVEWPGGDFLGALDCATVPRAELDLPYPESGEILFFRGGEAHWGESWGEVIYVADSSTASPRRPPHEFANVVDPVDYFATPQVYLPNDTGWYEDVAFDGLDSIADIVGKSFEEVPEQFALGGFPNVAAGPEWDDTNPYLHSWDQEEWQRFALLRTQYRVLLLSDSNPQDNDSLINYVIRTQDMAAGRFDTVEMFAEVGP
jgi:hypothetical protein